jgi:hypothetical protein
MFRKLKVLLREKNFTGKVKKHKHGLVSLLRQPSWKMRASESKHKGNKILENQLIIYSNTRIGSGWRINENIVMHTYRT